MAAPIISVRNVSKRYQLGAALTHDTLRDQLAHAAQSFKQIFRPRRLEASVENDNILWALRDVSFDVQKGEVLAIVGRNGAGKSTLLKVLSQITEPTSGEISVRGRIASLLEVGTGFHPELSGRENIYLNGAILGMRRAEIDRNFDSIVAFAEVEKFLDTPVKRYSSGMYVRLAFAVAAHLEPEILVVDEVLAVGDAQFQKKCLGKMHDVAQKDGRTVLFVSHNMTAIKSLCTRAVLLEKGRITQSGSIESVIAAYLQRVSENVLERNFDDLNEAPGTDQVRFKSIKVIPEFKDGEVQATVKTSIRVECEFWNYVPDTELNLSMRLYSMGGECIFNSGSSSARLPKGMHKGICTIPGNLLNNGLYTVSIMIVKDRSQALYFWEEAASFEVADERENPFYHGKWPGAVRPKLDWKLVSGESSNDR